MNDYRHLRVSRAPERPPLLRRRPRVIAGVARGLSVHLGGPVAAWRWTFALTFIFGSFILYFVLWIALPEAQQAQGYDGRLARPLEDKAAQRKSAAWQERYSLLTISIVLLIAAILIMPAVGARPAGSTWIFVPLVFVIAGAAIAWSHPIKGSDNPIWITALGAAIATMGALGLVAFATDWRTALAGIAVGVAVTGALALVVLPILLQNRNRIQEEQFARIRESERADIAAHLHDSVLQTLALIRSRATDPEEVIALARSQERDLRRYLYADRPEPGGSVAEQLRQTAVELEELYRSEIDAVITGDSPPTTATTALIGATREALTNAAKHAPGKISLYAELSQHRCEVFVRDRGPGLDLNAIPSDRAGIRDSIKGRIEKVGGSVDIRSPLPAGGTEVRMRVERGPGNE
ncbi:MAG: PspC domain-containing protein [Actinomycetaceae bacterium]|nr:PspC domain-containing protein [Actinomycetaceae bacterium]